MALGPGGLLRWLVVGPVAGRPAGRFMKGGGYGLVGDIVAGIIGASVGGLPFGVLMAGAGVGFVGSVVAAFIGAIVLIGILRALSGRSRGVGSSWRRRARGDKAVMRGDGDG